MSTKLFRNGEGYYDPTAGAALSRIRKEERRKEKAHRQEHPDGQAEKDRRKTDDGKRIHEQGL